MDIGTRKLHLFWRLTTKWWFYVILYFVLVGLLLLYFISLSDTSDLQSYVELYFDLAFRMPNGLVFLFALLTCGPSCDDFFDDKVWYVFPILVFIFMISSIAVISLVYKFKGKVLRWLIILTILLMVLAFGGCVLALNDLSSASFY